MMLAILSAIEVDWLPLFITGGGLLLVLGLVQLYLGLKAQNSPDQTGEQTMLGETGIIRKASTFRQRSLMELRGELWWCRPTEAGVSLAKGDTVEVTGIEDDSLILLVRPAGRT